MDQTRNIRIINLGLESQARVAECIISEEFWGLNQSKGSHFWELVAQ